MAPQLFRAFLWWWIPFLGYVATFRVLLPAYIGPAAEMLEFSLVAKVFNHTIAEINVTYPWWSDAAIGFPLTIFLTFRTLKQINLLAGSGENPTPGEKRELAVAAVASIVIAATLWGGITNGARRGFLGSLFQSLFMCALVIFTIAPIWGSFALAGSLGLTPKRRSP